MKPTKEQIIEWTTLSHEKLSGHRLDQNEVRQALEYDPERMESAIEFATIATAAAYAKGQEDMRERCANTVDKIVTDRNPTTEQRLALQIASEAVRALPTQKGGKG